MANALAHEKSPYLLQHAENPVDWMPWGEAAFAKARAEKKPIFLSIAAKMPPTQHLQNRSWSGKFRPRYRAITWVNERG